MLFVVLGLLAQCLLISVAAENVSVAATVPRKTFISILDFYALLLELRTRV